MATDPSRGAGHVARCGALGEALAAQPVAYFCDPENPHRDCLRRSGAEVFIEAGRSSSACLRDALGDGRVTSAILDSYDLADAEAAALSALGFVAAFRDGPPYGAEHVSIDLSPAAPADEVAIAGPAYAPLRAEYAEAHRLARRGRRLSAAPMHLLIAFGALDSANLTALALDAVAMLGQRVTVMLGERAPHLASIRVRIDGLDQATLAIAPAQSHTHYLDADLAIGSPGVSQLERMCCGLPTLLVAQNDTHRALAQQWQDRGAARAVPTDSDALAAEVRRLLAAPDALASMRGAGLDLVDGAGVGRLAEALQQRAEAHPA